MPKKKSTARAPRAGWRLLRLAFVCVRKRLVANIRHALNHLNKSLQTEHLQSYQGYYELSFNKSPMSQSKKYQRSLFPCVDRPLIDISDSDDDYSDDYNCYCGDSDENSANKEDGMDGEKSEERELEGEAGIDSEAEEFISRFYEELRLQRQASCLRYNEMLYRGMS